MSLICPAPPTSIFRVPLGPRFDFKTPCSPDAAATFTALAAALETISALGLISCTLEVMTGVFVWWDCMVWCAVVWYDDGMVYWTVSS